MPANLFRTRVLSRRMCTLTGKVCHYYTGYGLGLKQTTILLDIAFSRDNYIIILLVRIHRHIYLCVYALVYLRPYVRG